jgi:hypothetical protein
MRPVLAWMQWPHENYWYVHYFWMLEGLVAMGLGGAAMATLLTPRPEPEETSDAP